MGHSEDTGPGKLTPELTTAASFTRDCSLRVSSLTLLSPFRLPAFLAASLVMRFSFSLTPNLGTGGRGNIARRC